MSTTTVDLGTHVAANVSMADVDSMARDAATAQGFLVDDDRPVKWHSGIRGTLLVDVPIIPQDRTRTGCVCAVNSDGSVTTLLCPRHAETDPCLTMASVTGRRRKGTIRNGVCTYCQHGGAR